MRYAIIDIETTGGNPSSEKITEIAIYVHDGEKVIDEFVSLVNPEKYIPPFITGLTGITNEMVESAPKFFEIAKQVVLKTEDTIFVAHNAKFDYGFVKTEFKRLGFDFSKKTLDTVHLSRKLLPGHASYSLGKLCADLNISINGRHRAAGDALATVKLFEMLLKKNDDFDALVNPEKYKMLKGIDNENHKAIVNSLPDSTGVYYFYNDEQKLIYIGKSINIKKRVAQHLSNSSAKKALVMSAQLAAVHIEKTGSELVALLLESDEIKKHQPIFNRSQRRTIFSYALYSEYDVNGYIKIIIDKVSRKGSEPIATFANKIEIQKFVYNQIEKYGLCQKLCGLYNTEGACFHFGIRKCKGACIGKESNHDYNVKAMDFINSFSFKDKSFFIVDEGRNEEEKSLVYVLKGKYKGFGYLDKQLVGNLELMEDCIKKYNDNRDVHQIINLFLRNKKYQNFIHI